MWRLLPSTPHSFPPRQRIDQTLVLASLLILVVFTTPSHANQQDAPWRVGVAKVDITPSEPIRLGGYASRTEPFEGVVHPLAAKALLIEDAEGERGLIITTDLLGLPAELSDAIADKIGDETGLSRSQILINSSHTHTGPLLVLDDDEKDWPEEQVEHSKAYTRELTEKLVTIGIAACDETQPARFFHGKTRVRFVMNRREFTDQGVKLGVNRLGPVDPGVDILRIDSADGDPIVVLFGVACHLTTLGGDDNHVSGDFAGYAQQFIETEFEGAQAMFLQGCGGDANPFPRGNEAHAQGHGRELGEIVVHVAEGELREVTGLLNTQWERVPLPLQAALTPEELELLAERGSWQRWNVERMREKIERDGSLDENYPAPIAVWQFGDDLTLVGLSGEVVVEYVEMIRRAIGPHRLWVSAYCNDVLGYVPSALILDEGGYETRGLYRGGIGQFSKEVEEVVIDAVVRLSDEAGRSR